MPQTYRSTEETTGAEEERHSNGREHPIVWVIVFVLLAAPLLHALKDLQFVQELLAKL